MSCNMCNKEKAECLAEFIVNNFHCCPIDENYNVQNCTCWGSDECKKCLLENTKYIKISK